MNANDNMLLTEEDLNLKIDLIENKFKDILKIIGYDIENDIQIKDTPRRIAKMWIKELFKGNFEKEPNITIFDNTKNYNEMVFLGPIQIKSVCSHHFIPFIGECYIAYLPDKKIVGISKLARITKWFMRRPQIQEELTKQISDYLEEKLEPLGVAVYISAQHLCMTARGVEEYNSKMKTSALKGAFLNNDSCKKEFFDMIRK